MAISTYSRPRESYNDWANDCGKPVRREKELYKNVTQSGSNRANYFQHYVLNILPAEAVDQENENSHAAPWECLASYRESLRSNFQPTVVTLIARRTEKRFLANTRKKNHIAEWLNKAISIDQEGRIDQALDVLYRNIDRLMRIGEFSAVNNAMKSIDVGSTSVDILLGLLTATLPARSKLSARSELRCEVEKTLRSRGEYEDDLLTGL